MALTGRGSQLEQETVNARIEDSQQTIEELTAKVETLEAAMQKISNPNEPLPDDGREIARVYEDWAYEALNPKEKA